jgi:hypothetical protein
VSVSYFEQALDAMQKKYGQDSSQLISVYQSLGRVSFPKNSNSFSIEALFNAVVCC